PVATFFFLTSSGTPRSGVAALVVQTQETTAGNIAVRHSSGFSRLSPALDTLAWLVEAWLLGVAFFSLRSAGGFLLLERERRKQSSVVTDRVLEICHTLQDRFGLTRA